VLSGLKELKVQNWTYLVEDSKACCELVQKTDTQRVVVSAEGE
jgi:hypothetical protein